MAETMMPVNPSEEDEISFTHLAYLEALNMLDEVQRGDRTLPVHIVVPTLEEHVGGQVVAHTLHEVAHIKGTILKEIEEGNA